MNNDRVFQELIQPKMDYLYSFARYITRDRTESEDLVQETIIRAMERFDQFEEGTNLRAWLSQIMKNLWIDECRSRNRRSDREFDYAREIREARRDSQSKCCPESDQQNIQTLLNCCVSDQVKEALVSIPEKYRRPFLLYTIRDLKYEEIGEVLDCPLGTVRSRLHRAKQLLKAKLPEANSGMEPFRQKSVRD